eukprot:scaffold9383_cov110-Skeletonema_marinoi.AAC.2
MRSAGFLKDKRELLSTYTTHVSPLCATDTAAPHKQSNVLLDGRLHDAANSAVSTTISSRAMKFLLFLLTILLLAVPYGREILHELGTDNMLTKTINARHILPNLLLSVDTGPYPQRIAPLDPTDKFSFVHISKCAGSTWIRLFKEVLKLNICFSR